MNQPQLFDVTRTIPTACPVPGCGAIRLPQQARVPTCHHDLDPDHNRRPRHRPAHCLNRIDPSTAPLPEGF